MNSDSSTASSERVVESSRLASLTGWRWWAAFAVFLFHMHSVAPVPKIDPFARFGYYGVAFFFILSGFVLTWSAKPGVKMRNFYWRRFARIYPAHIVALLLALPVFYRFGAEVDPAQWWVNPMSVVGILLCALLLQAWFWNPAILFAGSPVAWTLTVEAFFYAIHPLINRWLQRFGRNGAVALTCFVVLVEFAHPIVLTFAPEWGWGFLPLPILRVGEFLLGMSLAVLVRQGWRPRITPALPVGVIVLYALGYVSLQASGRAPGLLALLGRFETPAIILLLVMLVLAAAVGDLNGKRSIVGSAWMVRLGIWSFAFYLIHSTVMYAVITFIGVQERSWSNLVWYPPILGLALLAAWLLYRFVEHPAEARMRRWGDARWSGTRQDERSRVKKVSEEPAK